MYGLRFLGELLISNQEVGPGRHVIIPPVYSSRYKGGKNLGLLNSSKTVGM